METAMQMMRLLRDTRQQIADLRQRTEDALAFMRHLSAERRQDLDDIQTAKEEQNVIYTRLATNIAAVNKEAAAATSKPRPANNEPKPPAST